MRRIPKRLATLILLVAFQSLVLGSASAYKVRSTLWAGDHPGDPVTFTYSYSNFLDGGMLRPNGDPISIDELKGPIEEAFSVWASYAPLHFIEVEDFGPPVSDSNYPDGVYGDFRIGHHYIGTPGGLDVKAHAYYPSGSNLSGDVHFDDSNRWQVLGTLDMPDILGAAIHEIGHSLGLDHSELDGANMYPYFLRHTGPGSGHLTEDDILGIQEIYGPGVGSVTPLGAPIPEPACPLLVLLALIGLLTRRNIL